MQECNAMKKIILYVNPSQVFPIRIWIKLAVFVQHKINELTHNFMTNIKHPIL